MKHIFQWVDQKIQSRRFALIVLGILTAAVFINILPNQFLLDDFDFISNWSLIKDIRHLPRFFVDYIPPEGQDGVYSPLRTTFFSIGYLFFRENPVGWHILSLITHLFGVWAVYCLTQLLAGNRWLSFLTAALFAVHPVHVESVTAVTGSIDTIGVVLGLWSFYWYIRAVLPQERNSVFSEDGSCDANACGESFDRKKYAIAFALGVAAMLTHELVLTLPILIFMFDAFFLVPRFGWRRAFLRMAPFLGFAIMYIFAKASILGGISRGHYAFNDPYRTFLIVIKAWAKYFGVLAVPVVLTHNKLISNGIMSFGEDDFDRAAFFAQSWHDPQVLLSFLLLAGVLAAGISFYRKKPLIAFAIFWFYITMAPVSQIIPSSVYYGERYLYPGSWGYCLILAWIFIMLYKRLREKSVQKNILVFMIGAVVAAYGIRTAVRNRDFRDWITGYEKAVQMNPQSAQLKNDLGILYSRAGYFESAEQSFLRAIAMKPDNAHFYFSLAEAYAGAAHDKKAMQSLEKAIEVKPDFAEAYFNLAGAVAFHGNEKLGMQYLDKAIEAWKKEGKIFEAGEAKSAFFVFLAERKGLLKEKIRKDFM